jgi:uncharacterized protein YeeX (DUF496 family)
MRPIKFDLPLNGTRLATLAQLEENLTPEILEPLRSGKLAKWLRVRKLDEQAEAVEALLAADNEREVQLFKNLCEVFVSEVDEDDARETINDYKISPPSSQNELDDEIEQLKAELAKKELEIEQLMNTKKEPKDPIQQIFENSASQMFGTNFFKKMEK